MRKIHLMPMLSVLCLSFLSLFSSPARGASPADRRPLPRQQDLFLPPVIYAVPGVETCIYFQNVFLTINPANYVFDVACQAGRQDLKRWRFTPAKEDAGKSFSLTLRIHDLQGLVAQEETVIRVAPRDAGAGRNISVLVIGDSLTNANIYPTRINDLMKTPGNPGFRMIGSHQGGGRPPVPGGPAHEGYGGWAWNTFLERYTDVIPENATRVTRQYARSPFLFKDNGTLSFDLKRYLQKYNQGQQPDIITFQLGVNDVFSASDENLDRVIQSILKNADRLLDAVRKDAPDAVFGVGFVTGGAGQDAFGENYKCGQTSWGYNRNHFRLNQAMFTHLRKRCSHRFFLVPVQLNLDRENNFPARRQPVNQDNPEKIQRQCNGVHPAPAGYRQIGDTYYAWMKFILSQIK